MKAMRTRERKEFSQFSNESGFTLIEMAIVLIIIGIIIGAVVKGKDIIRSGEQKKLYSTFISAWETTYSSYYDRTGWILGDDIVNPQVARDGRCGNVTLATGAILDTQLAAVGLESPVLGPTGVSNVRTYTDSAGNFATLTIQFGYDAAYGNFLQMAAIPNELGMAIDRVVDGQMDGTTGNFLYIPSNAAMGTTGAWPLAATAPAAVSLAILRLPF
ncbi:MAG: prepilin-type N-terminal cleavage/methylation domain-containing protein [Desulfobacterales bacterium]|nr:prepilin-type N-terminal cleavage/methylation domain-containing protein [Desulfobacterales bacterium]